MGFGSCRERLARRSISPSHRFGGRARDAALVAALAWGSDGFAERGRWAGNWAGETRADSENTEDSAGACGRVGAKKWHRDKDATTRVGWLTDGEMVLEGRG